MIASAYTTGMSGKNLAGAKSGMQSFLTFRDRICIGDPRYWRRASAVERVHPILQQMLVSAVMDGLIHVNPAADVLQRLHKKLLVEEENRYALMKRFIAASAYYLLSFLEPGGRSAKHVDSDGAI